MLCSMRFNASMHSHNCNDMIEKNWEKETATYDTSFINLSSLNDATFSQFSFLFQCGISSVPCIGSTAVITVTDDSSENL